MKTVNDFDFKDKKALIRVDFNVPLNKDLEPTDTSRIEAAIPTIIKVLEDGGSCVLMSHLGRPKNREAKFSLRNIVGAVSDILGAQIKFVNDCIGESVTEAVNQLEPGEILLLENLRYYNEEKEGAVDFARQLSELGDIYVNDAFGTAHRDHASTALIAQFFPQKKCFGLLLASEIMNINKILQDGEPPITAIIGGAKISSKITIIENILDEIDHLIIGGGMAFTFIKAQGGTIGNSLIENDKQVLALEILELAKQKEVQVHLPVDVVIANEFSNDADIKIADITQIPEGWMGLDTGPRTNQIFGDVVNASKTILWNGPLGVFEMSNFANGTIQIGNAIGEATKNGAFSLVGGGDSVAAVKRFNIEDKVSYVSTGGGAMLEMLEGKSLPGIEAILN
jgi:phosphoglycerate kinase